MAGLRQSVLAAPLVLTGPMIGPIFKAYVEQVLTPCHEPADMVVMDNVSVHRVAGVEEAIRAAGASILDPPLYSRYMNNIEQATAHFEAASQHDNRKRK